MWKFLKKRKPVVKLAAPKYLGSIPRVGQNVTLKESEKVPGLIGMPMVVVTVNQPFVVIVYKSIGSGGDVTLSVDLRTSMFMGITKKYIAALASQRPSRKISITKGMVKYDKNTI